MLSLRNSTKDSEAGTGLFRLKQIIEFDGQFIPVRLRSATELSVILIKHVPDASISGQNTYMNSSGCHQFNREMWPALPSYIQRGRYILLASYANSNAVLLVKMQRRIRSFIRRTLFHQLIQFSVNLNDSQIGREFYYGLKLLKQRLNIYIVYVIK